MPNQTPSQAPHEIQLSTIAPPPTVEVKARTRKEAEVIENHETPAKVFCPRCDGEVSAEARKCIHLRQYLSPGKAAAARETTAAAADSCRSAGAARRALAAEADRVGAGACRRCWPLGSTSQKSPKWPSNCASTKRDARRLLKKKRRGGRLILHRRTGLTRNGDGGLRRSTSLA
jgi:hypothetical protein